jgi:4a-hydroxytetrahydrobiopterin dehydratase
MEERLRELPGWHLAGDTIRREVILKDFAESLAFVNTVGDLAEKANHHPDIDIRWNKVILVLTTHSMGGLTEADFSLASQIEALP